MDAKKFNDNLDYIVSQFKVMFSQNNNNQAPQQVPVDNSNRVTQQSSIDKNFHPYWNTHQDKAIFNETLDRVHSCLEVAAKYGGRVFGGFVRNILIPTVFEQLIYGYKDVDIWFQSEEAAELFVAKMGTLLTRRESNNRFPRTVYPFSRKQFLLNGKKDTFGEYGSACDGIIIDVIVSENLPVDDFNVNQLTYSPVEGYKSFGKDPVEKLMACIVSKKATMLPGYNIGDRQSTRYAIQRRRIDKMLSCGWTIIRQDGTLVK